MTTARNITGLADLAAFAGRWSLTRQIDDRQAGQAAQFEGQAAFTWQEEALLLTETGHLRLPGQTPLLAERRYIWQIGAPGQIAVRFADGRAFHSFALRSATARADHWCDPDRYEVRYDFSAWPDWRSHWTVCGPRKDYCMTSLYRRLGEDGGAVRSA